jgi:hypothetical protein
MRSMTEMALSLQMYVRFVGTTRPLTYFEQTFNVFLGSLVAGDVVYVAVGPRGV